MKRGFIVAAALMLLACMLAGCTQAEGFLNRLSQLNASGAAEQFNKTVDAFFASLDAKDAGKIRDLFAPAVVESEAHLDAQIETLFTVYSGTTDLNLRDGGMASGGSSTDHGVRIAWKSQRFPVVSDGENYLCHVEWMYENDEDPSQIGIRHVILMNLDTEYAIRHGMDGYTDYPEEPGIHVLTDYDSGLELRFVEGHVEQVKHMDRMISEEDICSFFADKANRNEPALRAAFGEPNGEEEHVFYRVLTYELQDANGEPRYFRVFVDAEDEKLSSASITGEFEWISTVFE